MSSMLDAGFLDVEPLSGPDFAPAASGLDLLVLLFDELSHGVLVVNEQRQLLHSNEAARRELARCGVLYTHKGELLAFSVLDGKALQTALGKAAVGKRSLLKLSASGMNLTLSVVPLRGGFNGCGGRIALFFARGDVCDSGMFNFFARSHHFTPTEEQVLVFLCRSFSTPEIALQMKVAVSTVRTHVRSLCAKTASNGARELVNMVATLPPVGPMSRLNAH